MMHSRHLADRIPEKNGNIPMSHQPSTSCAVSCQEPQRVIPVWEQSTDSTKPSQW